MSENPDFRAEGKSPYSSLTLLWEAAPGFQAAVRALLNMDPRSLQRLADETRDTLEIPDAGADRFGVDARVLRLVLQLLRTLYDLRNEEGEPVLEQLETLTKKIQLGEEFSERRDLLLALLTPRNSIEISKQRSFVARAMMPVLEHIQMTIELRLATEDPDEDLRWVPVVTSRFTFDEPIQSGTAMTFQMTRDGVTRLRQLLTDIEGQFDQVKKAYKDDLL